MGFMSWRIGRSDPEKRDINQLVFDLAEYGHRTPDVQELYRRRRLAGNPLVVKVSIERLGLGPLDLVHFLV
jgi:hypothetical protein